MTDLPSVVEFSTNIKDQEQPDPLPEGVYTGVIRSAIQRESVKGTRYAEVGFFIGADQFPADYTDGGDDGMTLMFRRVQLEDTPKARFGLKRFLEAVEAPMAKKIDLTEWIGLEGQVEIENGEFEGIRNANIKSVKAA